LSDDGGKNSASGDWVAKGMQHWSKMCEKFVRIWIESKCAKKGEGVGKGKEVVLQKLAVDFWGDEGEHEWWDFSLYLGLNDQEKGMPLRRLRHSLVQLVGLQQWTKVTWLCPSHTTELSTVIGSRKWVGAKSKRKINHFYEKSILPLNSTPFKV
jgi:hypothetical protein